MINLKYHIFLQLFLVLIMAPILAYDNIDLQKEKDLSLFIDTLKHSKVYEYGYNSNKEKTDSIFNVLQYVQATRSCDTRQSIQFFKKSYLFLRKAKLHSLSLKLIQEYLDNQCSGENKIYLLRAKSLVYYRMGKYNKSILYLNHVLSYAKEIGSNDIIPDLYRDKSYIYWSKDIESGDDSSDLRRELNERALELYVELNNIKSIQATYTDLGSSATTVEKAIFYFENSLKLVVENEKMYPKLQHELNFILRNYASHLISLNEPKVALKQIEKIDKTYLLKTYDSLHYNILLANYQIAINNNYESQKIVDQSILLLNKYKIYNHHQYVFLRSLSKLCKQLQDFKGLKNVQKRINDHVDNTFVEDGIVNIELNRLIVEQRENEKILAKNDISLKETELGLVFSILILLMSTLLTLFYRKRYNSKKRIEEKVRVEQKKLINKNILIQEKNTSLGYQKDTLEVQLKSKLLMLSNRKEVIGKLITEIEALDIKNKKKSLLKSIVYQNEDSELWKRVEEEFLNADKKFVVKLLSVNPNITPSNIKLCTLIKLGLTNKEIAKIRSTSTDSVKVAKNRLRNYLGISENNTSIYNFLKKIEETP